MNLEIVKSDKIEQHVIEEMKRYTDIFSETDQETAEVVLERSGQEGYSIRKDAESYIISYRTFPDLCRALLLLSGKEETQTEEIKEQCVFHDFGIMLDLSRNAVLKVDTVKQMICYAACLGLKFVGLYMEDTFLVEEEPYLGYMRGRVTHE